MKNLAYKLIKIYPGSPKLGTLIYPWEDTEDTEWFEGGQTVSFDGVKVVHPEIHPEFWEAYSDDGFIINSVFNEATEQVEEYVSQLQFRRALQNNSITIFSVKNLLTDTITSVGDVVVWDWAGVTADDSFTIKSFILKYNGSIGFDTVEESTGSTFFTMDKVLSKDYNFRHYEFPLFISEDGVKVFQGDTFYTTCKNTTFYGYVPISRQARDAKDCSTYLRFSSKEKAEEYIEMNIVQFTQKDLNAALRAQRQEFDELLDNV